MNDAIFCEPLADDEAPQLRQGKGQGFPKSLEGLRVKIAKFKMLTKLQNVSFRNGDSDSLPVFPIRL